MFLLLINLSLLTYVTTHYTVLFCSFNWLDKQQIVQCLCQFIIWAFSRWHLLHFTAFRYDAVQVRFENSLMQTQKNFRKIVFTSVHFNSLSVSYALTALIFNYVDSFISARPRSAEYTIGICFETAKNTKAFECFFTGFQRSYENLTQLGTFILWNPGYDWLSMSMLFVDQSVMLF